MCRQTPTAMDADVDSDCDTGSVVTVHVRPTEHVGITVIDTKTGVKVTCLKARDAASRAGIRINDVIMSMNKLPCHSHEEAVKIWNAVTIQAKLTKRDVRVVCAIKRQNRLTARMTNAYSWYQSLASRMCILRICSASNG